MFTAQARLSVAAGAPSAAIEALGALVSQTQRADPADAGLNIGLHRQILLEHESQVGTRLPAASAKVPASQLTVPGGGVVFSYCCAAVAGAGQGILERRQSRGRTVLCGSGAPADARHRGGSPCQGLRRGGENLVCRYDAWKLLGALYPRHDSPSSLP